WPFRKSVKRKLLFKLTGKNNLNKESLAQRMMKIVIWNFIGQVWMVILGFFATPFIVRSLKVELYGIYALIGVIIGYFSFLQFGLGTAQVKYISEYYAIKETEKIRRTFWVCIIVYSVMGFIGTVSIFSLSHYLTFNVFKISLALAGTAVFVLKLGSLGFLISMVMSVLTGVFQAVGRFDVLNRVGIILGTLQIGLTVLFLKLGFSIKEVIIINLLVQVLGVYILWGRVRKILPYLSHPVWDTKRLVDLFKFGGFVTVSSVMGPILLNIEKLFLTSLRPINSLAYYSVPFGLMDKLTVIRSSFSAVLFPAFSSQQQASDQKLNAELHERSSHYIIFLYSFFVLFFMILGKEFLGAWIGADFAFNSWRILLILSWAGLVNALAVPSLNALQGLNKPHIPALFYVIETILYVPCAYFLIARFGGSGAALAWLLRVSLDTSLLTWASCRFFKKSLLKWYGLILSRVFFPFLLSALGLWGLKNLGLRFFSFINLAGILCLFLSYCFIVWKWSFDDFARMRIRELIKERLGK
ncbi:MAG: flippase, partial [Candidatus Omnitrophica bacterium]|nr:flippase [Candidatus Omnitrophota bacterium]